MKDRCGMALIKALELGERVERRGWEWGYCS